MMMTLAAEAVQTIPPSFPGVPAPPRRRRRRGSFSPRCRQKPNERLPRELSNDISRLRSAAGRKQDLAAVRPVVTATVQVGASLRLRFCVMRPLHVVEARFQEEKPPRERCPAVQFLIRGEYVRPVPHPCCHVQDVRCESIRFRPERPSRWEGHATEQPRGLQARFHRKLKRHSNAKLDHTVVLGRVDGRMLATNAKAIKQRHDLRLRDLCAVVRGTPRQTGCPVHGCWTGISQKQWGRRTFSGNKSNQTVRSRPPSLTDIGNHQATGASSPTSPPTGVLGVLRAAASRPRNRHLYPLSLRTSSTRH